MVVFPLSNAHLIFYELFLRKWYHDVIQRAMLRLLGSDHENTSFFNKNKEPDEWSGRMHYLQQEMARHAEESTAHMNEHAKAMEQSVNRSESRLRSEVKTVEQNISDFKGEIMNELRESEQRLQGMMLQSMNQFLRALVEDEHIE